MGFNLNLVQDKKFDIPLDPGIERAVLFLRNKGIETFESCEGGKGHAYTEPTVRFHGQYDDLLKAAGLLIYYGFPLDSVRRYYSVLWNELVGPYNEVTFYKKVPLKKRDTLTLGFES